MAEPNYDLLNQVQFWASNPNSPIFQAVKKEMAAHEGLPPEQYNQVAAQLLLEKIQQQFGGAVPDRKAAAEFDYARRAQELQRDPQFKGTPEDALKAVRSGEMPYAHAYGTLDSLKQMLPQVVDLPGEVEASITEPGPPTKVRPPKPPQLPSKRPTPPANDDEQLSEAALGVLYGLARTGKEYNTPQTLDEADSPDLAPRLPYVPKEAPERTAKDATPEQLLMENYKKAFQEHEMAAPGMSNYAQTPLPPGWVRNPEGVPMSAPGEPDASKEEMEKRLRNNIYRMLLQEAE